MNHQSQTHFLDKPRNIPAERLAWLWLLIGFALLPFTAWQTVIPLAAWLAPVFLLRFARTSARTWTVLMFVLIAYVFGNLVSGRGLDFSLLGFIGNDIFKTLLWTLPYIADRLLSRRLGGWMRLLAFPLAFTTVDLVLSLLRVSSSGSPAYSQDGILPLMQIVSVTGMWGITFLIMWFASSVNALWENHFNWRPVKIQLGLFASVLAAVLLFGGLRLALVASTSQTVKAASITLDKTIGENASNSANWTNYNQYNDQERAAIRPILATTVDQMLERTETALRSGAKLVGWQEGSGLVLEEDKSSVLARASALARQYDATLQISLEVVLHTHTLPYLRNQSILIDSTGQIVWTYDKTHPVPYDEAFATISGSGILPLADTPYGRLSTAICYDTYFPALLRQAGENNTDILLAPTNDVRPYASSAAAMATYRAIENGFSLIRPTGHGISLMTDAEGRIISSQDYFAPGSGIMLASIPTHGIVTIYSRIGDAFAYLCAAGFIFLAILALLHRKQTTPVVQRQLA